MDLTKIYGIEFDEAVLRGGEKRICDAAGLENDYVVGQAFQKHSGKNDFDNAYPFGAMRLCNVSYRDGVRHVIYENEPGFTRTGESGNAMVEIPKFYSRREKIGTVERWMISGTKHPGFEIEPAFLRGEQELDVIYVGCYNTTSKGNGLFSSAGEHPDTAQGLAQFREEFTSAGYDSYDLAIYLCLQKLIVIEFGTRYVKQHLGGIGYLRYAWAVTPGSMITHMGPNRVTVNVLNWGDHFAPGHEIALGHNQWDTSLHRTVTKVEFHPDDSTKVDIYYDGEDLQGTIFPETDAAYGMPQKNGLSDSIGYHTGRTDLRSLDPSIDYLVNAFRYRGIENVWGSVWELMDGLRIKNLQYCFTFDPEHYADETAESWNKTTFKAPNQPYLTARSKALWIDSMGFDPDHPLVMLPVHSTGDQYTYGIGYDSVVYAYDDVNYDNQPVDRDYEWRFSVGGGWDHSVFGSLFSCRGFMRENKANWLYSSRVCLRR